MSKEFKQCEAIVVTSRSKGGGRGALQPPRRCRRVAIGGSEYCEVHAGQAEIQGLYRELLVSYWETKVARWEKSNHKR